MAGIYMTSFYLGRFLAGALIGGGIPFIIFAIKKQWGLAFVGLLVCGLVGFIHPVASIVAGILFLIGAIKAYNNRS